MKRAAGFSARGCIDGRRAGAVMREMKPAEIICKLAETFKVLGDPTRTKIIFALSKDELCVCDLARILGAGQSLVSHQLRILRNMNLVKYRKDGRVVYYSLDDEHIKNLFDECLRHVEML